MANILRRSNIIVLLVMALSSRFASAQAAFDDWNLEPSVAQAHLVMVARVNSISRVTVVEGAKTDVALREYRFQPVRRLKGIFQRDELSMTAADLGCPPESASDAPPLKEGEFRLLILAQQSGLSQFGGLPSFGCVSARPGVTTFDQRVPLLTGPDDPLVAVVETLMRVADSRSRRQRAMLLVDRLEDASGPSAVPLLTSLALRADWAAADIRAYEPLARLAREPLTAVRVAALEALRDMLASRNQSDDPPQIEPVAEALREILESDEPNTRVRLAALNALGHLLALKSDLDWPRDLLVAQLSAAATYAEQAAAATALSHIPQPESRASLLDALAKLPLDETPAREAAYARAILRYLPDAQRRAKLGDLPIAERALLDRLKRSLAARQSLEAEVDALGRMRSMASLPLLLEAAGHAHVSSNDRYHIAVALGRLGDDQAVPVLSDMLRGDNYQLKEAALAALESIDSPVAAREVRPLLKSEAYLPNKLRMARLLARHDIADGYVLATEHLADVDHTPAAVLVLAELNDPRTTKDLSAILKAQPDRRWHAATLAGLGAIGDEAARKQLREILADDRHPLAADAAEAAGLSADWQSLVPLAELVQSRNKHIAMRSLTALRRYFSGVRWSPWGLAAADMAAADSSDREQPGVNSGMSAETRAKIAESVASLAADAYVDPDVRREALTVARLVGGERYDELLSNLADQAELEGTQLMAEVQLERRRLHAAASQP